MNSPMLGRLLRKLVSSVTSSKHRGKEVPVVFIKSPETAKPSFNILDLYGHSAKKGEVGLEIEVEGNCFPKPPGHAGTHHPVKMPLLKYWSYVHDGSLRGVDNAEYVLSSPIAFNDVEEALNLLWADLRAFGSVLDDSNRTSVHVHLNVQRFHLNRLTAFCAIYYVLEDILIEWCGDHRVGNLFCLAAKDAPGSASQLRRFIQKDGQASFSDGLHYAALNPLALAKHGSVEIRTMRGPTKDFSLILDWVRILERIYNTSDNYKDPRDLCRMFSSFGPRSFMDSLLGEMGEVIRNGVQRTDEELYDSLYEGMRIAQDLCFCRDWSTFTPYSVKKDAFGRSKKKVMEGLQAAQGFAGLPTSPAPMMINTLDDAVEEFMAEFGGDGEEEPDYDEEE